MKATIELNEKKLRRVMKLTGIKTQKQAIDFALDQAEKVARIMNIMQGEFYTDEDASVVDPKYDYKKLRSQDKPS